MKKETHCYKYHLAKYSGRSSRIECPNCGRHHCFTPYVDDEGNVLDLTVGRCDHESSCGYHYTPRQFYVDHPERQYYDNQWNSPKSIQYTKKIKQSKDICTINIDYVKRSVRPEIDSDFTRFLKTFLPEDKVKDLVLEYNIGVTNSGDVIFFEIDQTGQCRTGKIMKYDGATGHRIQDSCIPGCVNWVHSELKRNSSLPNTWESTHCLFGEHLLKIYQEKTVALVESEKTAVICAAFMPEFIWLATGGRSQLNDRVRVLKGRKVVAYPDIDGLNEWKERASKYPEVNITVSSLISKVATPEAVDLKVDIADWIIEWAKLHNLASK